MAGSISLCALKEARLDVGAQLQKPFSIEELARKIGEMLESGGSVGPV